MNQTQTATNSQMNRGLFDVNPAIKVGQILTIISAIFWCITIVGMIWGIPMIVGCAKRISGTKRVSAIHVVLAFLFFFWIGALITLFGIIID